MSYIYNVYGLLCQMFVCLGFVVSSVCLSRFGYDTHQGQQILVKYLGPISRHPLMTKYFSSLWAKVGYFAWRPFSLLHTFTKVCQWEVKVC